MPIPIKHEINIVLKALPELIDNRNSGIQELFTRAQGEDKVKVLETILGSLVTLKTKFNYEIDKLQSKVEKQIEKEKRNKR